MSDSETMSLLVMITPVTGGKPVPATLTTTAEYRNEHVQNVWRPDPKWLFVDAFGHEHRWYDDKVPSAREIKVGTYRCDMCEDDHDTTEWHCLCGLRVDKPRLINTGPRGTRFEERTSHTVTFTSREPWATSLLLHLGPRVSPRDDVDLWVIIEGQVWGSTFRATEVQGRYSASGTEADVTLLMTREMERA